MKGRLGRLLLFAALLALVILAPSAAFADTGAAGPELYKPDVVVTVEDDPSAVGQGYVTYAQQEGDLKVVLCGVTDANKKNLAKAVLANVALGKPVKFVNQGFVDADKYSTDYAEGESFDQYHCWLGSTSNILTFSGWASRYVDPITGTNFANEDDVLGFFTSSFADATGSSELACSYFLDGLFGGTVNREIETKEATAAKPYAGNSQRGFDPQVCSAGMAHWAQMDSSLSDLSLLEGLQEHALETTILGGTAHSVAIVGAVIDESKQGADRYVAVLITDTDNEECTSDKAPSTYEQAYAAKSAKTNSYTLYHLSTKTTDESTHEMLEHYLASEETYLGSFTNIKYYSDAVREAALETSAGATCDATTTGDVALSTVKVYGETTKKGSTFGADEKLNLNVIIMDMNVNVPFDQEHTGASTLQNRIECYRDGVKVGVIEDPAFVDLTGGAVKVREKIFLNIDLSGYGFLKEPGTYELRFFLNTGGIAEAYVMNNNSPLTATFTIKDNGSGSDPTPTPSPSDSNNAGVDSTSASSTSAMAASSTPATGDAVPPLATLLLSASALIALVGLRWGGAIRGKLHSDK